MIEINLNKFSRPERAWETAATLRVDDDGHLETSGDQELVDHVRGLVVLDRRRKRELGEARRLTAEDDLEEWARNLDGVLRGPMLFAEVVRDSHPLPKAAAGDRDRANVDV
jgi:hypothetical protein